MSVSSSTYMHHKRLNSIVMITAKRRTENTKKWLMKVIPKRWMLRWLFNCNCFLILCLLYGMENDYDVDDDEDSLFSIHISFMISCKYFKWSFLDSVNQVRIVINDWYLLSMSGMYIRSYTMCTFGFMNALNVKSFCLSSFWVDLISSDGDKWFAIYLLCQINAHQSYSLSICRGRRKKKTISEVTLLSPLTYQ